MTIQAVVTHSPFVVRRRTAGDSFDLIARQETMSQALLIPGLSRLNPNKLFAQGQPGGWPDPYDLTRMWVDDAGTTPMTLANLGTGPGRVVTKGNAITLTQANAADRPVWGRHPVSGIRNLLDNSNGFSALPWVTAIGGTGVSPIRTANAAIAPDGTMTATRVDFNRGAGNTISDASRLVQTFATSVNGQHTQSIWMRAAESADIGKQVALRNVGGTSYGAVTLTADWVRYTRTETGTNSNFELASRGTFSADNQVSVLLWEGQLEAGATATTNQTVTNRFDITEVGSPSLYYFDFNGVSQAWTSNATVNFSTTNRMTIWAGLHKRNDVNAGRWCSLGVGLPVGGFTVTAPPNAGATSAGSAVRGTTATAFRHITIAAPATYTQSVEFNLAGATNPEAIRNLVNGGGTVINSGNIPGGGNFANAVLQIGRDGASTDPFNGRLYTAIIAGAAYDSRTVQRFAEYTLKPRRLITA